MIGTRGLARRSAPNNVSLNKRVYCIARQRRNPRLASVASHKFGGWPTP